MRHPQSLVYRRPLRARDRRPRRRPRTSSRSMAAGSSAIVIDEPIGPTSTSVKHIVDSSTIEPISIEFGLSGADDMLQWIQASWNQEFSRRNGQITHADFDLQRDVRARVLRRADHRDDVPDARRHLEGRRATSRSRSSRSTVTTQAALAADGAAGSIGGLKQKMWTAVGVPLHASTASTSCEYTNKIESFTIKQGIKKLYTGEDRFPQIEPTKIEFPNITGTIVAPATPTSCSSGTTTTVVRGRADTDGAEDRLDRVPRRRIASRRCFAINLFEVGMTQLQIAAVDGERGADQAREVRALRRPHGARRQRHPASGANVSGDDAGRRARARRPRARASGTRRSRRTRRRRRARNANACTVHGSPCGAEVVRGGEQQRRRRSRARRRPRAPASAARATSATPAISAEPEHQLLVDAGAERATRRSTRVERRARAGDADDRASATARRA